VGIKQDGEREEATTLVALENFFVLRTSFEYSAPEAVVHAQIVWIIRKSAIADCGDLINSLLAKLTRMSASRFFEPLLLIPLNFAKGVGRLLADFAKPSHM
jgi:hypothetical protein